MSVAATTETKPAPAAPPPVEKIKIKVDGREIEVLAEGNAERVVERLKTGSPEVLKTESLTLEEIFVAALQPARASTALA